MENKHKRYCMIFNTESFIDGIEFDTIEDARDDMTNVYYSWMQEEMMNWEYDDNGFPTPTKKQIENWDYMICNCCCWISEWDEENEEYYDSDNAEFMTEGELNYIGWIEWEKLIAMLKGEETI